MKTAITLLVLTLPLCAQKTPQGKIMRMSERPVLSPQGSGFEEAGAFNPAVVRDGDHFVMLYRAQDSKGTSRLGYAESKDGVSWKRRDQPVLVPEAEYEKDGGVEDPRLVKIGADWILTYTAYNKKDAQLALATSRDLIHWQRKGVIMPAYKGRWNVNWTKSGAILDQKVKGRYWMYFMADAKGRPDQTGVAWSSDLLHWNEVYDRPVLPRREGRFDSRVTEPGPPPIMTKDGVLLIYNGADDKLVYRTGWALFDVKDPSKLLARSDKPVFVPEREWEMKGQVPNVVFVEGMVVNGNTRMLWYGAADKFVGLAEWR